MLGPVGMKDIKGYKPADTLQKVWSLDDYKMLLLDHSNKARYMWTGLKLFC